MVGAAAESGNPSGLQRLRWERSAHMTKNAVMRPTKKQATAAPAITPVETADLAEGAMALDDAVSDGFGEDMIDFVEATFDKDVVASIGEILTDPSVFVTTTEGACDSVEALGIVGVCPAGVDGVVGKNTDCSADH